jgi:hypothetical protein
MERATHPLYSPDLALCDFYPFGYVKHLLAGREFADRVGLQEEIMAILDGIEKYLGKGVSHLDGKTVAMHRDQWRVSGVNNHTLVTELLNSRSIL